MKPDDIQNETAGDELRLSWRWYRWPAYFLIGGGLFFFAYMLVLVVLFSSTIAQAPALWLVLGICAALGLWMLWAGTAFIVNKTTVLATREMVQVRHQPVPYHRSQSVPVREVERFEPVTYQVSGRRRKITVYAVDALLASGSVRLVKGVNSAESATYIAQSLNKHLGFA